MPSPSDYSVGWICTTDADQAAAKRFLDAEHAAPETLSLQDGGCSSYVFGRVGSHFVVVVTLRSERCGDDAAASASTASVATGLKHKFPNMVLLLDVGAGNGVPSRLHDVRPGDIVVSNVLYVVTEVQAARYGAGEPGDDSADKSRATRMRRYYGPSVALKGEAKATLKSLHEMRRHAGLTAPDLGVRRDDGPAIHYGAMATGRRPIADALWDQLAEKHDIRYSEIGGGGRIIDFSCIVVRGTFSRSGAQTDEKLHEYAVLAAAAYTKDLICHTHTAQAKAIQQGLRASPQLRQRGRAAVKRPSGEKRQDNDRTSAPASLRHVASPGAWASVKRFVFHQNTLVNDRTSAPASLRHVASPGAWASVKRFVFHQNTLVVILLLLGLLSGMMVLIALQQTREPACDPRIDMLGADDGFWTLLSQLFLQTLSVFCTLYPVILNRELKLFVTKFWFGTLLAVSLLAAVGAVVAYSWSWRVATVLSFATGFAQIISAGQLAVGLELDGWEGMKRGGGDGAWAWHEE